MAQRATGIAGNAGRAGRTAPKGAVAALRAIPLDILPVVAPYKGRGRLSIRIERLPHHVRLSQGRNNGDHSFSLTLDELEDLQYLLPESVEAAHTLAVRIISLDDGDGSTLAVIELPVSPKEGQVGVMPAPSLGSGLVDGAEIRRLREELQKAKEALAALQPAQDAQIATQLAAMAAAAEERLVESQKAWKAEEDARFAALEERVQARLREERENWRQETADVLAEAEEGWRAAERARLAAAETAWRKKAALAQSQAGAQLDGTLKEAQAARAALEKELQKARAALQSRAQSEREVRTALAEAQAARAALERELREAQAALQDRAQSGTELRTALADAKAARAALEKELQKARAALQSRAQSETEVQTALAEAQAARAALERELREAQAALATAHSAIAGDAAGRTQAMARAEDAEAALAKIRQEMAGLRQEWSAERDRLYAERERAETARKDREAEISAILSRNADHRDAQSAATAKKLAEADARRVATEGYLKAREAELQRAEEAIAERDAALANLEAAAAQAVLRAEKAEAALLEASQKVQAQQGGMAAEQNRLTAALAAAQRIVAEREADLQHAQQHSMQIEAHWQQKMDAALAKAERSWRSAEASRLSAAKAEWQVQAQRALDQAVAAAHDAALRDAQAAAMERAAIVESPSPSKTQKEAPPDFRGAHDAADAALERLRDSAWQILAARAGPDEPSAFVQPQNIEDLQTQKKPAFLFYGALAAILAAVMAGSLLFMPPQTNQAQVPANMAYVSPAVKKAAPPQRAEALILRAANMRAAPSVSASVLATLPKGTRILVAQQKGDWIEVVSGARRGWIYRTLLEQHVSAAD